MLFSLLQQPGPKQFKLSKIDLIYKARKLKVPLFTIYVFTVTPIPSLTSKAPYKCNTPTSLLEPRWRKLRQASSRTYEIYVTADIM